MVRGSMVRGSIPQGSIPAPRGSMPRGSHTRGIPVGSRWIDPPVRRGGPIGPPRPSPVGTRTPLPCGGETPAPPVVRATRGVRDRSLRDRSRQGSRYARSLVLGDRACARSPPPAGAGAPAEELVCAERRPGNPATLAERACPSLAAALGSAPLWDRVIARDNPSRANGSRPRWVNPRAIPGTREH